MRKLAYLLYILGGLFFQIGTVIMWIDDG